MTKRNSMVCLTLLVLVGAAAAAADYDCYKYLRCPKKLLPDVGRNKVEQEGGPDAVGYKRRTVQWWPRKGHDIVDIPKDAPLRTWTRKKGQEDKEALAGVCRNWTTSDSETFKAHLIGFRGFGVGALGPRHNFILRRARVPGYYVGRETARL